MTVTIFAEGLTDLTRYLDLAPRAAKRAARLALNQTVERKGIAAIRALMAQGDHWPEKYDLSKLKVLGSVGEPINQEAWEWYYDKIGKGKIA